MLYLFFMQSDDFTKNGIVIMYNSNMHLKERI